MAETVALVLLCVVVVEAFVIWMLNDELKKNVPITWELCSEPSHDHTEKQPEAPRTITAKDMAAANLNRQVVRKSKSWADIRARVESMSDMDPEVARSKRVEKFIGDN
jgi:hypothetical protein